MDTTRSSLLLRVRNHADSSAWAQFDQIYRPFLMRFVLSRGICATDAEDVVQQCMEAVSRHIENFDYDPTKGRFKAWLRTITTNKIINILRRERAELPADGAAFSRSQSRETSPEELFDQVWRAEHLRHCLELIKGEVEVQTYQAFCALMLEDKSVDQVCEQFGMTPGQVHLIKYRMVRRLRERMIEICGETD